MHNVPDTYTCPCCLPDKVQMVLRIYDCEPQPVVFDCLVCGCAVDATPAYIPPKKEKPVTTLEIYTLPDPADCDGYIFPVIATSVIPVSAAYVDETLVLYAEVTHTGNDREYSVIPSYMCGGDEFPDPRGSEPSDKYVSTVTLPNGAVRLVYVSILPND